ncbi:MAG: hypothetical protein Q7K54_04035 [Candidatus Parcubacteria bacterium]|nr:hypothetical protein [Candidatus Parcubacteria bacterium]
MKQKDVLIIIILLFVFVLAWIGSSLYHTVIGSTISETTNQDILPIQPSFNNSEIDKLKQRQKISPSFDLETITPTPIPTLPTQIVTQQKASAGGELSL